MWNTFKGYTVILLNCTFSSLSSLLYYFRKNTPLSKYSYDIDNISVPRLTSLGLIHVSGIVFLLVSGLALAGITFIFEIYQRHVLMQKLNSQKKDRPLLVKLILFMMD